MEPLVHGWAVPRRYGAAPDEARRVRESCGLADWSWVTKIDLKEPAVYRPAPFLIWQVGGPHGLVICEPSARHTVDLWVASQGAFATDVTGGLACFLIAGPRSGEVLRKLTSLDIMAIPDQAAGQASVAHTHGTVLRQDVGGILAFYLLVGRDYGFSVWHDLLHAGREFHLRPVGVDAIGLLR